MLCYECAKLGREEPAVAICPGCGAGLCLTHLRETAADRPGGAALRCGHDTWEPSAVRESEPLLVAYAD